MVLQKYISITFLDAYDTYNFKFGQNLIAEFIQDNDKKIDYHPILIKLNSIFRKIELNKLIKNNILDLSNILDKNIIYFFKKNNYTLLFNITLNSLYLLKKYHIKYIKIFDYDNIYINFIDFHFKTKKYKEKKYIKNYYLKFNIILSNKFYKNLKIDGNFGANAFLVHLYRKHRNYINIFFKKTKKIKHLEVFFVNKINFIPNINDFLSLSDIKKINKLKLNNNYIFNVSDIYKIDKLYLSIVNEKQPNITLYNMGIEDMFLNNNINKDIKLTFVSYLNKLHIKGIKYQYNKLEIFVDYFVLNVDYKDIKPIFLTVQIGDYFFNYLEENEIKRYITDFVLNYFVKNIIKRNIYIRLIFVKNDHYKIAFEYIKNNFNVINYNNNYIYGCIKNKYFLEAIKNQGTFELHLYNHNFKSKTFFKLNSI